MNPIFINNIKTYPKRWVKFLNNYKQDIEEIYVKNILSKKDYLMEIFASIINTSRRPIMCYHATRLTKEEIIQINRDGIIPYNRETLKLKLDLLKQNKYISDDEESKILKYNQYNIMETRENKIYLFVGILDTTVSINNKSDIGELLLHYGGEVIYRSKQLQSIEKRLIKKSIPCIIECKVPTKLLPYWRLVYMASNIMEYYVLNKLENVLSTVHIENHRLNVFEILNL